jgi:DNA-binding GntR family transcriptional regulator
MFSQSKPFGLTSYFHPPEKKGLISKAYQKIKEMLYNQQLVPGQKIIYEDLARAFNMSTTPIINALSRLEQDGLVILKYNRGYYVTEISEKEAEDLLEARHILEEYSIKKLISANSEVKIKYLEKILKQMKDYRPSSYTKKRLFMDAAFHVSIAEMGGNQIVRELLNFIYEKIYLRYRTERIPFNRMDEADKEHTLLLNAIKKKNLPLALKILDGHFIKVRKNLLFTIRAEM